MALFKYGTFTGHAGGILPFKIECDALSNTDYETLAKLVSSKLIFSAVHGIPRGGLPFAKALKPFTAPTGPVLIVDDVLTTGTSMEVFRTQQKITDAVGVVIFARGPCPDWIRPIFTLSEWVR